jgi:outer membrane protein
LTKSFAVFPALVLGVAAVAGAQAQAPTKVAIIAVQQAILQTKDGQKASQDLQTKFTPRKNALEQKQTQMSSLQDQLKKGGATMSDATKEKISKDIAALNTALTRDNEDFEADVQQEEQKIMSDLGGKIMDVITKYASGNGIAMVIDVSNQQTPVLWADPSVNITDAIIKLYDQAHPGTATAAPATAPAAAPPAAPKPAAPKPAATPPATKK